MFDNYIGLLIILDTSCDFIPNMRLSAKSDQEQYCLLDYALLTTMLLRVGSLRLFDAMVDW